MSATLGQEDLADEDLFPVGHYEVVVETHNESTVTVPASNDNEAPDPQADQPDPQADQPDPLADQRALAVLGKEHSDALEYIKHLETSNNNCKLKILKLENQVATGTIIPCSPMSFV